MNKYFQKHSFSSSRCKNFAPTCYLTLMLLWAKKKNRVPKVYIYNGVNHNEQQSSSKSYQESRYGGLSASLNGIPSRKKCPVELFRAIWEKSFFLSGRNKEPMDDDSKWTSRSMKLPPQILLSSEVPSGFFGTCVLR